LQLSAWLPLFLLSPNPFTAMLVMVVIFINKIGLQLVALDFQELAGVAVLLTQ
jgi:hypothetical protein